MTFLKRGECYGLALLPSIIYIGRLRIASRYIVYIQSVSRLFDSVMRTLGFYPGRPGSNPTIGVFFFQLCFSYLLRHSCRKKRGKVSDSHRLRFTDCAQLSSNMPCKSIFYDTLNSLLTRF